MIDRALSDYTNRVELAPLRLAPRVWAGHYSDDRCLGQMAVSQIPDRESDLSQVAFGLLLPWGLSQEVETAVLIFDEMVTPGIEVALQLTIVTDHISGLVASHYRVPVETHGEVGSDVGDLFCRITYGAPEQDWPRVPGTDRAVSRVMDRRPTATASFDDAYHAALIVFEETFG